MKFRCGFVTNSSSSSFLVARTTAKYNIGEITKEYIQSILDSGKKLYIIGKYCYEGYDLIDITCENIDYIKENICKIKECERKEDGLSSECYIALDYHYDGGPIDISKLNTEELRKNGMDVFIEAITIDNSCSGSSLKMLEVTYED